VFMQIHTVSVAGHAIDPEVGSKILLEGNYFNTVRPVVSSIISRPRSESFRLTNRRIKPGYDADPRRGWADVHPHHLRPDRGVQLPAREELCR
jgi:hypothetical protein